MLVNFDVFNYLLITLQEFLKGVENTLSSCLASEVCNFIGSFRLCGCKFHRFLEDLFKTLDYRNQELSKYNFKFRKYKKIGHWYRSSFCMDFRGILHIKSQGKLKCVKRYSCQLLPARTDASQYVN